MNTTQKRFAVQLMNVASIMMIVVDPKPKAALIKVVDWRLSKIIVIN